MDNNKENGLTLVEVLCGVALLGIILILVSNLHLFGLKQYFNQSDHINTEADIRLALNMMTKDIRSADATTGSVAASSNILTITKKSNPVVYKVVNKTLYKNSTQILTGVQSFSVSQTGTRIDISITSVPGKDGKSVTLTTAIYIRG